MLMSLTVKMFIILLTLVTIIYAHPATYPNYVQYNQQIDYESPQVFDVTPSPLNNPHKSQAYQEFIKELYRFDKAKVQPLVGQQIPIVQNVPNTYHHHHPQIQQYPQANYLQV